MRALIRGSRSSLRDDALLLCHHRGCCRGPGRRAVLPADRRKGPRTRRRRLYDPGGENEVAPLVGFGWQDLGALDIEFRAGGGLTRQ
jgi:hypothetical protein